MFSSTVKMPRALISSDMMKTMKKKPSSLLYLDSHLLRHHSCYKNTTNNKQLAAAPLVSSSSSCEFRLGATPTVDSATDGDERGVGELPGGLRREVMPEHVAVIMDGNGRWAKERGLPTKKGHLAGRDCFEKLVGMAWYTFHIKVLTVYVFSTENWNRPQEEVDFLMSATEDVIRTFVMDSILRHDIRFSVIGDKSRLPPSLQSAISLAEESSKPNNGLHLVMAISYSGRCDITEATRRVARKVKDGNLREEDIDEGILQQHLMTTSIEVPDPDLLIRTSGEKRTSNFLLWQLAYTEFYFIDKFFPDLDEADLVDALTCYQTRKRRYGGR